MSFELFIFLNKILMVHTNTSIIVLRLFVPEQKYFSADSIDKNVSHMDLIKIYLHVK